MARNKKPAPAAPSVEQNPVEQVPAAPALPVNSGAEQTSLPDDRRMTNWHAPAEVEPLAAYAARIEEVAQPLPVCEITHPDAKDGAIHTGKYAGIRLKHGAAPAALLSDGSTI